MFRIPDIHKRISRHLSYILRSTGVNEHSLQSRRQTYLQLESIRSLHSEIHEEKNYTFYNFGSQTEGSTTFILKSDLDTLICFESLTVLGRKSTKEEWDEALVADDHETPPGYCHLNRMVDIIQPSLIMQDMSHPFQNYLHWKGNALILDHNIIHELLTRSLAEKGIRSFQHGPSHSVLDDFDIVFALPCYDLMEKSDEPQIRNCSNKCFVVPVGHPGSDSTFSEWRISFSLQERYQMFNLNITQMQCYVLMKLIKKQIFTPIYGEKVTSYHCKTALFHTIKRTRPSMWITENLVECTICCLQTLYTWAMAGFCPHFFNSRANLFIGKLTRCSLDSFAIRLQTLMSNELRCIFDIEFDKNRLNMMSRLCQIPKLICWKLTKRNNKLMQKYAEVQCYGLSSSLLRTLTPSVERLQINCLKLKERLVGKYNSDAQEARFLYISYSTLNASLQAAQCLQNGTSIDENLLNAINSGLECSSSISYISFAKCTEKLKLSSIYLLSGNVNEAGKVLGAVESEIKSVLPELFDIESAECLDCTDNVLSLCLRKNFDYESIIESNIECKFIACVRFLFEESACCPKELRYEMFRTLRQDRYFRTAIDDMWMDAVEVDAVTFMIFLRFKILVSKGEYLESFQMIIVLKSYIVKMQSGHDTRLGHLETAFNVIGQCFEILQTDAPTVKQFELVFGPGFCIKSAFDSYVSSLLVQPRNNAAKWLLPLLVFKQWKEREPVRKSLYRFCTI